MGEQVYFEVVSLCAMCMSSCIVCKHRASLPSVWLYKTHCVPWGSQAARRRGCTVCKKNATFHCVLDRPQSLFYFVPQEISQLSMIGYCVPPCVFSVWKHGWLSSRTGCSCRTSFHNAESCVFWDLLSSWRRDHTEHMRKVCLLLVFQFPWCCTWCKNGAVPDAKLLLHLVWCKIYALSGIKMVLYLMQNCFDAWCKIDAGPDAK